MTKAIVEQKIDEMDLMRDEMLLNGSSATDSIDLESISELIANIESLSNHFEHKSLDQILLKTALFPRTGIRGLKKF